LDLELDFVLENWEPEQGWGRWELRLGKSMENSRGQRMVACSERMWVRSLESGWGQTTGPQMESRWAESLEVLWVSRLDESSVETKLLGNVMAEASESLLANSVSEWWGTGWGYEEGWA
jgi:hypothetical protein